MNILDVKVKVNGSPEGKYIFVRSVEFPDSVTIDLEVIRKSMEILFGCFDISIYFIFSKLNSKNC